MRTYKGGYLSGKKGRKSKEETLRIKKEVCFKVKRGKFLICFDNEGQDEKIKVNTK